jgi:hypothetical protein
MTTMRMRSIMLGGPLCLGTMLAGCPFEDPPVIQDTESTGAVDPTIGTTSAPPTTSDPTTSEPTTSEPSTETMGGTTTVSADDTSTGATTSAVSDTSASDTTSSDPCVLACDGLACGTADSCECGTCGPMATCADDQSYCGEPIGYSNVFPDPEPMFAQRQIGFRFTVLEPRTVRRLGVIASGAGSDIRLALYDHDGSGPANRVVQTGAVTLYANGPNEFDVGATPIVPGDYWVMIHTDGPTPLYRTLTYNHESANRSDIPFVSGFPVTMDDETTPNDSRWNLYMVVEEG